MTEFFIIFTGIMQIWIVGHLVKITSLLKDILYQVERIKELHSAMAINFKEHNK